MFGKWMNNYFYGKSGKGDFEKEDLPQTRWQLFWDTLRVRLSGLVRLNLMYAIAWLPAIFVLAMTVLSVLGNLSSVDDGTLTAEQLGQYLRSLPTLTLTLLIPCITLTGPFTAGVAYVTRNWARDEHAFIWSDFKDAIKENWKQALLTSFVTSLMPVLMYVCYIFYGQQAQGSLFFLLPQALSIMVGVLWLMSLMYQYPLMVTYKLKWTQVVRNAWLLTIARLPQTAGLKLLSLVPLAITFLAAYLGLNVLTALVLMTLYFILLGFALSRFVQGSYANAVFDKYINPNIEGAKVGQGLYHEDEGEDTVEDVVVPGITDAAQDTDKQ